MPWYDYQCEKCGSVFEIQRAMSDVSKARCKSCGSVRTSKIFSPAGVQFKGGGFYVTDSRNKATNGAAAPVEANSETATTDAKPAAKPKAKQPKSTKQES